MRFEPEEIAETLSMISRQNLDVRTVTLGLSLRSCSSDDIATLASRVYERVTRAAARLVPAADAISREYGIPIVNKRISVTPVAELAASCAALDLSPIATALDRAATERVCASVNVASTRAGINWDAVVLMAHTVTASTARTSRTRWSTSASRARAPCARWSRVSPRTPI